MATTRLMTAEDLWVMPDGEQYELYEGILIRMSPTGGLHGKTETRLVVRLGAFVDQRSLGEVYTGDVGFVLAREPDTVLGPDIAFVRQDRLQSPEVDERFLPFAPDLAVEIRSPTNRPGEIADKVRRYQEAGTPLIWVNDPKRQQVTVHRLGQVPEQLTENDTLDGGEVLPGFELSLVELWRR